MFIIILANCSAGTYLEETENVCEECAVGSYQGEMWQTQCDDCLSGFTTADTGSTDSDQCISK